MLYFPTAMIKTGFVWGMWGYLFRMHKKLTNETKHVQSNALAKGLISSLKFQVLL